MSGENYFTVINHMTDTINKLAVEKEKKVKNFKSVIIILIISNILLALMYTGSIFYIVHNIYNYDYSVTNTNSNSNSNFDLNVKEKSK